MVHDIATPPSCIVFAVPAWFRVYVCPLPLILTPFFNAIEIFVVYVTSANISTVCPLVAAAIDDENVV